MVGPGERPEFASESATLLRPREVAERLGVAPATLRMWSNQFADRLDQAARGDQDGGPRLHRRYSFDDLDLLIRAKELLDQGLTYQEAQRQLAERVPGNAPASPLTPTSAGNGTDGLASLPGRLSSLPRKQYQLAQAVLNTPEMIMFGSVRELASQLDVNNATIVRFAQSLGFSGYQALQAALRQAHLPRAGLQPPRDTASRRSPETASSATLAQHKANLHLTRQHLTNADLDAIAAALIDARLILVAATGSSIIPANLFVRLLRHVGLRGELVRPEGVDRAIALYDAGPGDVVVGIGLWLTFQSVVEVMALGRRLGATTIAITGSPTSPLAQGATHLVLAPAQGAALSFSVMATVAVVEAIIAHIAGRRPEQTSDIEQRLHDLYLEEDLLAPLLSPEQK